MTILNKWQADQLAFGHDEQWAITPTQARSLLKAAESGGDHRRRRTTGNIFTTLSGRAQPRQGFLSLEVLRAIYLRSEVVRACIEMLIEFVLAVDWTIKPVDEENSQWLKKKKPEQYLNQQKRIKWLTQFFSYPSSYEDYDDFHRRLLRDLLIFDAGAYEIVPATYSSGHKLPLELGVVPGDTVEIESDEAGIPTGYWQSYNVIRNVQFETDELAYLMLNPCSWQPYGISPIETAFISITADLEASKYNADYFAKNGIPPGLLAILGVSAQEYNRIAAQLRQTSADNPHNIHSFRAQRNPDGNAQKVFDYVPLTQNSNREMQFQELLEFVTRRICMSYKVTPSQIGLTGDMAGGIGNGIADEQAALTQNKGVSPLLRKVERSHTTKVIHGLCQWEDLEFSFTASNTPQEQQEYDRSVQEVQIGAKTINEHRAKWGGRSPLDWGSLPLQAPQGWQPPMSPQQMQQQMQQQMMGGGPPGGGGAPGGPPSPQPPGPPPPPGGALGKSAKRIIINF